MSDAPQRAPDDLELLSQAEILETVDPPLLARQLAYVFANSRLYRAKAREAGLSPEDAASPANFATLPFTEKAELLADQEANPPYGRLAMPSGDPRIRRIHITSGSSAKPLYVVLTWNDVENTLVAGRRAFHCAGLTPEDTVIHCLNYCLWAGGVTDHQNLEATGATVIPFGVGNTSRLIETILTLRPTAISCTPSYMSRLEVVLKEEHGLGPRDLGLRKAFFGGEAGLQNIAVRARIEEKWGFKAIDANYGMADVLSIFGAECDARRGLHFHGQGLLHLELIDPETGATLPFHEGQVGEMVLTNLRREAQPLVRLRTRDVIRVAETDQCACGRRSFRFLIEGRSDQMIVVSGVNVFPSAIAILLAEQPERFSGEFEIVLDSPPPYDTVLLRVELSEGCSDEPSAVEHWLASLCQRRLSFTPSVAMLRFGEFPRTEEKAKRVRRMYV